MTRCDTFTSLGRRAFAAAVIAAAATSVHAQPRNQRKRLGILFHLAPEDRDAQGRNAAFLQGMEALGWRVGANLQIDYRWVTDPDLYRKAAAELVALEPDVLLTTITATVRALQQETKTIPIVFSSVIDPVGSGLVASLSHPGGNATGLALFEYGLGAKWVEFVRQVAPDAKTIGVVRDPNNASGVGQFAAIQTVTPALGVELRPIDVVDAAQLEQAIGRVASDGGKSAALIVTSSPNAIIHRALILRLAERYKLPAVYPFRIYAENGGLLSYGPDLLDVHRRWADYTHRILKGVKPAELPVQGPTKFELVVNLKAAKFLGRELSKDVIARADEVIE